MNYELRNWPFLGTLSSPVLMCLKLHHMKQTSTECWKLAFGEEKHYHALNCLQHFQLIKWIHTSKGDKKCMSWHFPFRVCAAHSIWERQKKCLNRANTKPWSTSCKKGTKITALWIMNYRKGLGRITHHRFLEEKRAWNWYNYFWEIIMIKRHNFNWFLLGTGCT